MNYGLPWQGSKSAIAEWVVGLLPASHTLVDLFAGGCAVTHAALLSGKWERIVANDMTDSTRVFFAAINGEFDGYAACPSRDEWFAYRDADTAMALLHSFGNDRTTYLWSPELEAVKRHASLMVSAPSTWERYQWYHRFCDALADYLRDNSYDPDVVQDGKGHGLFALSDRDRVKRLVQLERVTRLQGLQRLQGLHGLHGLQGDYRLVDIPEGATVYADPPYRSTKNSSRYGSFDFDAFDMWLAGTDFPVFVSEYTAPAGCVEVASTIRTSGMSASGSSKYTERLFVQERFADEYRSQTFLDLGDLGGDAE